MRGYMSNWFKALRSNPNPNSSPALRATPAHLPTIAECQQRFQALAMLDACLSPSWSSRYYTFDAFWTPETQLASINNGSGDHAFILFIGGGCVIKTFNHELSRTRLTAEQLSGLRTLLPRCYHQILDKPTFLIAELSSLAWFDLDQKRWIEVTLEGSEVMQHQNDLLWLLISDDPSTAYVQWAHEYFEMDAPLAAVQAIFRNEPLTGKLLTALVDEPSLYEVMDDVREIGYPLAPC